jgi:hypothetical protein
MLLRHCRNLADSPSLALIAKYFVKEKKAQRSK